MQPLALPPVHPPPPTQQALLQALLFATPNLLHGLQKDGYQILLDTKPVRTPAKHLVVLPSLPSALAVAAEWEWQVRPAMPRLKIRTTCNLLERISHVRLGR